MTCATHKTKSQVAHKVMSSIYQGRVCILRLLKEMGGVVEGGWGDKGFKSGHPTCTLVVLVEIVALAIFTISGVKPTFGTY